MLNEINKEEKKQRIPFNLQLFADGGEGGTDGGGEDGKGNENNKDNEDTKFSQSEVDKKISEALKTRETKLKSDFEKTLSEKISETLKENERLSKLSEDDKKSEEISKKEQDLIDREKKLNNQILKTDAVKELANLGISMDALDLIVSANDTDAELALAKIKTLKSIIEKSIGEALKAKMNGTELDIKTGEMKEVSLDDFNKMNDSQKTELYTKNQALYEKLANEVRNKNFGW